MFLNLPDRIFFEKEITRKIIRQNDHDWSWYFHITTNDEGLYVTWTGNNMNNTNYIILEPSDRTNRTVTFNVNITSDSEGNDIKFQYQQEVELIFEENLTWVDTYYPDPNHFNWNSDEFKLNVIPLTSNNPSWDVDRTEWRGYQCIGMRIWANPTAIEIPINNFAPQNDWNYAIVYGHWLDRGTNLLVKKEDGTIKPISWTSGNQEFELVLKPNECILYTCDYSSYGRGFGITYIWFFL